MIITGGEYRPAAGESWDSIALKVYGDEKYAFDLLGANPSLCQSVIFKGGERIRLVTIEVSGEDQNVYTPANAPWKD